MALGNLRVDIERYVKKIADYYWDNFDPQTDGSIWDWLRRDYGIVRIRPIGETRGIWVSFPDEQHITLFLLRWA